MMMKLESTLASVESAADRALANTNELAKAIKRTKAAAATGKLADLEKSISDARSQLAIVQESLARLGESWAFESRSYFESGGYVAELLAAMEQAELRPVDRDGRILCFPNILRVLQNDQAIEIDRKKERRVRPSFIAAEMKKNQNRKTGTRPEQMIEILYDAYEPLVSRQNGTRVVRFADIYELLTLLPQAREYSKAEFGRDLVKLDMSGVRNTRAGHRIEFRTDTGARSSAALSAVTPDGEVRVYSGVEFKA